MARRGAVTSRFKHHDAKVFISLLASDHIVSLYTNYVHLVFKIIGNYLPINIQNFNTR